MNVSLQYTGVRHWSRAVQRVRRVIVTGLAVLAAWPGVSVAAEGQSSLSEEKTLAMRQSLLGPWKATVGQEQLSLLFNEGTFSLAEGELTLIAQHGTSTTYVVDLQSTSLDLSGGDPSQNS
jgi:hypothetical protein